MLRALLPATAAHFRLPSSWRGTRSDRRNSLSGLNRPLRLDRGHVFLGSKLDRLLVYTHSQFPNCLIEAIEASRLRRKYQCKQDYARQRVKIRSAELQATRFLVATATRCSARPQDPCSDRRRGRRASAATLRVRRCLGSPSSSSATRCDRTATSASGTSRTRCGRWPTSRCARAGRCSSAC